MSEPKRFRMPLLDDPLSWPRDLRTSGTEIVLASDYDALRARLAEAEEIISTAARYWSVPGSSAYERKLLANAVAWIARGSVNGSAGPSTYSAFVEGYAKGFHDGGRGHDYNVNAAWNASTSRPSHQT